MQTSTAAFSDSRKVLAIICIWFLTTGACGLYLHVEHATAYTLFVSIVCNSSCDSSFLWEYKDSPVTQWRPLQRNGDHEINKLSMYITDLGSNKTHYVRVLKVSGNVSSDVLIASTCPDEPPPLKGLREGSAGPGWLDIRWQPLKEHCASLFAYSVQYSAQGEPYLGRKWVSSQPLHPCDTWPKEYCMLFTDKVKAGKHYEVKVEAMRIGGNSTESVNDIRIVYANPDNTSLEEYTHQWITGCTLFELGIFLPLWIVLIICIVYGHILLIPIVLSLCTIRCKRHRKVEEEDPVIYDEIIFRGSRDIDRREHSVSYVNVMFENARR